MPGSSHHTVRPWLQGLGSSTRWPLHGSKLLPLLRTRALVPLLLTLLLQHNLLSLLRAMWLCLHLGQQAEQHSTHRVSSHELVAHGT
jgi:hypothetical protein